MDGIVHLKAMDVPRKHRSDHEGYEFYRRELISNSTAQQCEIALYEIPPLKSAFPYHFHVKNEESFYIISGQGILKTPTGNQTVSAGDFLFFPADEAGAHKLTNTSETEPLIYLDYDTYNDIDVAFYPDSEKIGIWGKNIDQLYKTENQVEYFKDE